MNGPVRLRDGSGAAKVLMGGSRLVVPSASRRRALAFTGAAASMAAGGTAVAAGATSLVKSVVLCVCLGTVGGGVASLAISEIVSQLEARQSGPRHQVAVRPVASVRNTSLVSPPSVVEPKLVEAPASEPAPPPEQPATKEARSAVPLPSPAVVPVTSVAAKPRTAPSLFEEQRVIESARAAVARGDVASALSTLDDYQRDYSQGQFGPEALALRVEALRSHGDSARAQALAAEFRQKYPHHPLLSRVEAAAKH
jgi:hypothetical protein